MGPSDRRLVGLAQLTTSTIEGVALSTIVVHATVEIGLPTVTVGGILAAAAAISMALALPLGVLTDRLGAGRAIVLFGALAAAALTGYALADSAAGFAPAAIAFVVAQSGSGAARQALAVAGAAPEQRLVIRATMHTLLNAGIGLGTVIGAGLAVAGPGPSVRVAYGIGALVMVVTALVAVRLPRASRAAATLCGPGGTSHSESDAPTVWRDRRFAIATGLAAVIQLTMPVLAVILPLWLLERTAAPVWLPGSALAVNTVLVIVGQRPLAGRVTTGRAASGAGIAAAVGLVGAGALFAVSGGPSSPVVVVAVVSGGIVALTAGEIFGGTATWRVALDHVPADAEGRYQAAFSMSTSLARIAGPGLALPLVITFGPLGWVILTSTMALACLGIAALARKPWSAIDYPAVGYRNRVRSSSIESAA